MRRLGRFTTLMCSALIPVTVVVAALAAITFFAGPKGPFEDSTSVEVNTAYTFAVAFFFQVILVVFLVMITAFVGIASRRSGSRSTSPVLGLGLAALYVGIVASAVALFTSPGSFLLHASLGLALIALTWTALGASIAGLAQAGVDF